MDESIDAKCANLESVNENADTHDAVSLRNDETERDCDVIPSSPLLFAASQGEGKKPDKIPLSLSEGGNNEELVDKMLGNIEELKRICEHLDKRYYHVTSKVLELETLVKEITSGQAIGMSSASPVKFKSRKAKRPLPSQNESEAESTQLSLDQSVKNTNQSDQSDVENTNQSDQSDVEINSSLPPLKSFINKNIIPSLKLPLAGSSKGPEIERLAEMKDIVDDSLKNQSEKSTQLTVGGLQCDIIDLAQDVTQQGEESRFQDSPCSTESDVIAVTSRSAMCRKRVISSSDEEEQPRKFLKSSDLIARESTTKASRKDNCRSSAKRSSLSETSDNDQSVIMESCEQSTANIEVAKQSGEENILFEEGESFLSPASNTKEEDVLNNLTDEAPNRESSPVHETSNLSCGKIIIDDSDEEDGNNTPPITDSQVPPPTPPPVDTSYPPHPNKKVVNDLLQSISELTNDNADHDNQAPVEDEDTSSTTRSQPVVLPESENLENEQPKEEYVSSLKQDEDASQSQISKSSHQEMDDTDLDTTTNSSHIEVIHQLHDKTNEAVDSSRCLSGLSISNQSTGNPARKLGIMTSGLRGKAIAFVKLFTKKWGGKFYDTFVAGEVTHVVVRTQQMRCDRTLKYLQAVASKSWVVSISWVTHSLKQKTLLPEDRYEVIGDNLDTSDDMSFGPRRSRLSSPHFKLLSKHVVYCIPPFALFTEAQFIELIHLCGGRVVSRVDDLTKTQSSETRVITVDSDAHTGSLPDYAGLAAKYAAEAVSCTWILDCVATFSIQPTANFPVEDLDSEML